MSNKPFVEFKLEGAKELDRVLKDLPKGVNKNVLKSGLRKAGKQILTDARAGAPVLKGVSKKSIKIRVMTRTKVPAALSIGPSADNWFLKLIEFGTARIAANPFMRGAWERNKRTARDTYVKETWMALTKWSENLVKKAYAGKLSRTAKQALRL